MNQSISKIQTLEILMKSLTGEFPNNIRANNIKTKLVSNNIKMK